MKAVDTLYRYEGFHGCDCVCGLRVTPLKDGRMVVVCTEVPENKGTSVTNFAEGLASLVCTEHNIPPEKLIWIEHYPARAGRLGREGRRKPDWDLVTFGVALHDGRRVVFEQPAWRAMKPADWQSLDLPDPAAEEQ